MVVHLQEQDCLEGVGHGWWSDPEITLLAVGSFARNTFNGCDHAGSYARGGATGSAELHLFRGMSLSFKRVTLRHD